jgi:hypothetical protein
MAQVQQMANLPSRPAGRPGHQQARKQLLAAQLDKPTANSVPSLEADIINPGKTELTIAEADIDRRGYFLATGFPPEGSLEPNIHAVAYYKDTTHVTKGVMQQPDHFMGPTRLPPKWEGDFYTGTSRQFGTLILRMQ